ncbi:HEAT repeat domain-containing protein [candidate division WOR-3 bacterium]|nr:HEAT repeat domain-containing protein [candidate division WOR-3 bacterium]
MPEDKNIIEAPLIATGELKSDNLKERIENVKLYAESDSLSSMKNLVEALGDESWNVRLAAAEALGKKGSDEAVQLILDVMKDGVWYLKSSACFALGLIGEPRSVTLIYENLESKNITVAEEAAKAIEKIIRKNPERFAVEYLENAEPSFVDHLMKWLLKNHEDLYEEINSYMAFKEAT